MAKKHQDDDQDETEEDRDIQAAALMGQLATRADAGDEAALLGMDILAARFKRRGKY
jgi:hypothetical protein